MCFWWKLKLEGVFLWLLLVIALPKKNKSMDSQGILFLFSFWRDQVSVIWPVAILSNRTKLHESRSTIVKGFENENVLKISLSRTKQESLRIFPASQVLQEFFEKYFSINYSYLSRYHAGVFVNISSIVSVENELFWKNWSRTMQEESCWVNLLLASIAKFQNELFWKKWSRTM